MKHEKRKRKSLAAMAAITPRSRDELIALIEAGWLSAQEGNLHDGEQVFRALHAHLDQLAARQRPLPVIYV